jgi:hypothetical protein
MSKLDETRASWKQKAAREMTAYLGNVLYLFLFLGMFAMYRRLILAQYEISYLRYGISLLEALVLAKVIMIGEVLHLARGLESRPLIVPTLYKAIVFCILVGAFALVEHEVIGLLRGRSLAESFQQITSRLIYEWIAECLVAFLAFIPFFGLRELGRVLGKGKIQELFFGSRQSDFQV